MNPSLMLAAVLTPVAGGILIPFLPLRSDRARRIYTEGIVLLTSLMVWALLLHRPNMRFAIVTFVNNLSLSFALDGMGMVFAGLISVLWPLATLYAFEYMREDRRADAFFLFYTMTYGVTLGIAFAEDMLTLYFFYELLTLTTMPLVLHTRTREAIRASRRYLYYSLGGAAFAFIGLVFLMFYGYSVDFHLGGVLTARAMSMHAGVLQLVYVISFLGFGVKAAVCPFGAWLPQAGVAPTPVTALLHAVAVVKAGAFAILRLTYFSFGTDLLRGTWAQNTVLAITIFTIVYGCSRALKETHLKRRLAYSTISNLSYILFGAALMSPLGLAAALTHLVCHAVMKIAAFCCAGAVIHQTGREYVHELNGLGRRMPLVFTVFTLAALGLMGVPGLPGFVSKWALAQAALDVGTPLALAGIAALLVSALLTAIYLMSIVVRACFPPVGTAPAANAQVHDPAWPMCLPLVVFAVGILVIGLGCTPLLRLLAGIAAGTV